MPISNNHSAPRTPPLPAARRARVAKTIFALFALLAAAAARAATWYVDSSASGANNGASWANAWTSLNAVTGVKAGDIVYISGGPSGSSRNYSMTAGWTPAGGSIGSPITYQIGQDASHNGTATFNGGNTGASWLGAANNVIVSGDAGDGRQHFATAGYSMPVSATGAQNIRVAYVNFNQMLYGFLLNQANAFEIDHCYFYKVDGSGPGAHDYAFSLSQTSLGASSYDVNKIHDNTIFVPRGQYGFGDDNVQQTGNGLSLYNNKVTGYVTSYSGSQHQDGFQTLTGSYLKVYNNTFINMGNSGIFLDGYYGGFSNVLIFNNLIYMNTAVTNAYFPRGMDIISDSAAVPGPLPFVNISVMNNTFANYPTLYGFGFYAPASGVGSTYVNDFVANNICYNTGGVDLDASPGLVIVDNVSASGAGSNFVSYVALASAPSGFQYDFHLSASYTHFRGQGTNLSSYFTTDHDGNARRSTGPWDLGAYTYGNSSASVTTNLLPPTVSAIVQNAVDMDPSVPGQQILEGTVAQYSASASDPNGLPLTWTWSYAVNGGASITYQSGSGTVAPITFTYGTGTAGSTYVWLLTVSDGTMSAQAQFTVSVEAPPQPGQGLTFQAISGAITAPFSTNGGYVSQPVQTTLVANAGQAVYNFSITNAGFYVVQALVNAPTDAANSMYVNIDSLPVDPGMIWDITVTSGFEERLVSWRGNGTDTTDQFVPELFNLAQGQHQIIFCGREAGTQLQTFSILKVPNPPQGVQAVAKGP